MSLFKLMCTTMAAADKIIPPLQTVEERRQAHNPFVVPSPSHYEPDGRGEMQISSHGDYVSIEDYDNLRIAFDEALSRLREIEQLAGGD